MLFAPLDETEPDREVIHDLAGNDRLAELVQPRLVAQRVGVVLETGTPVVLSEVVETGVLQRERDEAIVVEYWFTHATWPPGARCESDAETSVWSMRVASILTASVLALGLTACGAGGGGGPSDLDLGGPTSGPVTTTTATTTTVPGSAGRAQVARARFAQLAVYESPDASQPMRVLQNPWTPKGAPRERIPQVLLVDSQQGDGWVKVKLPDEPQATDGWVRSFDVRISTVAYRIRIAFSRHRITVLERNKQIFQGPIRVADAEKANVQPGSFYVRRIEPARAMEMTASPYTYRFIARLLGRVPLGTPVEIAP
jgi:hypothetical protein